MTDDDVTLTEAEREALSDVVFPLHYNDPDLETVAEVVERILADRLAAVQAERAEAVRQARGAVEHFRRETEELTNMHAASQRLLADELTLARLACNDKEEFIAGVRAKLSHTEAERDAARAEAVSWSIEAGRLSAQRDAARAEVAALRERVGANACRHAELPDTLWTRLRTAEDETKALRERVTRAIETYGVPTTAGVRIVAVDRIEAALEGRS